MERAAGTPQDAQVLVRTLACVLQKLVDVNRKLDTTGTQVITKFHASRPPSITVRDYLERINKYASCSMECFVLALVYIDRLIQHSNFALTNLNVHRVIITSVMLAAKFFDDQYFNNLYYAKVGGVPCKEINTLEVEFLFLINFSLHVTEEQYYRYFTELANHATSSACPCCAGSRVSHGPASAFKSEPAVMVVTPPPVVPFQPPPPPVPQQQQPQMEVVAPAMEVQSAPPPPPAPQQQRFTYYTSSSYAEAPRVPGPAVMMVPPPPPPPTSMRSSSSSSLPASNCAPLFLTTGSFLAPRLTSTSHSVEVADWDRAPGRVPHHHHHHAAMGNWRREKFPVVDQTVLVGAYGGAYDYTPSGSYEYDYPPMMPSHRNKMAATTTQAAVLYSQAPYVPTFQIPLMP